MIPSELADILRRTAAEDLNGIPLYVAFSSALPKELQVGCHTFGYTGRNLDLAMQRWLEDCQEWRGRGGAIVINDEAIAEHVRELVGEDDVEGNDPELARTLTEQRIVGTGLHELAHALSEPPNIEEPPSPAIVDRARDALRCWCATPVEKSVVPFTLHDARFVRTLAHVLHRAETRVGIARVPRSLAFNCQMYGLSQLSIYERALESELTDFDGTFAELRETQPPAAFIKVWRNDLRHFVDELSHTAQIVSAIVDGMSLFSPNH